MVGSVPLHKESLCDFGYDSDIGIVEDTANHPTNATFDLQSLHIWSEWVCTIALDLARFDDVR